MFFNRIQLILLIYLINSINSTTVLRSKALLVLPAWYSQKDQKLIYPPAWSQSNTIIERHLMKTSSTEMTTTSTTDNVNSSLNISPSSFKGRYSEDRIAAELFFFNTSNGIMVEVGANDGYLFSSSYVFDHEMKWRTVVIEGDPIIAWQSPIYRPNALSINAIVCDQFKAVHFSQMGAVGGIVETMSNEFASLWHPGLCDKDKKISVENVEKHQIPLVQCIPLGWIIEELGLNEIDFMTLDLVGAELQALQSINLNTTKINVLAVSLNPIYKLPEQESKLSHFMSNYTHYIEFDIHSHNPASWNPYDKRTLHMKWFVRKDFLPSRLKVI